MNWVLEKKTRKTSSRPYKTWTTFRLFQIVEADRLLDLRVDLWLRLRFFRKCYLSNRTENKHKGKTQNEPCFARIFANFESHRLPHCKGTNSWNAVFCRRLQKLFFWAYGILFCVLSLQSVFALMLDICEIQLWWLYYNLKIIIMFTPTMNSLFRVCSCLGTNLSAVLEVQPQRKFLLEFKMWRSISA